MPSSATLNIAQRRGKWSNILAGFGVVIMILDMFMTGDFFRHIGELMIASLLCFGGAIYLEFSRQRILKHGR
ncbi:MAG: hypothetical protein COX57_06905 [Alphaproteobacteria bacterium CG_4_10_14_0_2_um_filter_63_37]|nr:MAG: hypothetical protein AUJ55_06855 [Proteobacteria bacterium CG1_02_64_396]PJA24725.1 MAG: hypothetical protein COX57_06905 [Alphaproteobacteria bacterium CG_4_10_14_0_2_um_filter_63_37]